MWQWKLWWLQVPVWPGIICFKWAPGAMQGVGREQRAGCQHHCPPCCVLCRAELGCRTNPASDTRVLQQWGQWQGTCWALRDGKERPPSWFLCSLLSLSLAVRNNAPGTSEAVLPQLCIYLTVITLFSCYRRGPVCRTVIQHKSHFLGQTLWFAGEWGKAVTS